MEKHCPHCHAAFQCSTDCWCSAFPPILSLQKDSQCMCPDCLKKEVQSHIERWMASLNPKKVKTIQQLGKPVQLLEGIDYTVNEQGFYVFTSWYLLRQGKCCGNGCTNCPYQNIEKS